MLKQLRVPNSLCLAVIGLTLASLLLAACDQRVNRPPLPPGPPGADPNVALLKQAKEGDLQGMTESLKAGADVNYVPDPVGRQSPLINAAGAGHVAAVRFLLEHGALANMRTTDETPLHAAAVRGQTEVVRLLLAWGTNYSARIGLGGQYALGDAAIAGHAEVVWLLYQEGAFVDPALLCFAVADGQEELVKVLLRTRIDHRSVRCAGQSLLELARQLEPPQRDRILAIFKAYEPPASRGGRP